MTTTQQPRSPRVSSAWVEAIEGYLAHDRAGGRRSGTTSARRAHLSHLARRVTVSPWAVTSEILVDYFAGQQWASETRRGRRTTVQRFFSWGVYRGFVQLNPADALPMVRSVRGQARPTPDRAYQAALLAAPAREELMIRLAAEVGLRRGEVCRIHTDDLVEDLVGRSLIVYGKGGRVRTVPLPTSIGEQIASSPRGYLFPGRDNGHLSPRYVGKVIRDLLPGDWTMHTLRHRCGTQLYALTSDLLLVQRVLGHSSPSTTLTYVDFDTARMRAAVEQLSTGAERTA